MIEQGDVINPHASLLGLQINEIGLLQVADFSNIWLDHIFIFREV